MLFDLDGVLVDSRRCVELVWRTWGRNHGVDVAAILRVAHGRRTSETLAEVAPHLDVAAETAVLDALEESEDRGIQAGPGARELVGQIGSASWAIVTSGSPVVARRRLRLAGIAEPAIMITGTDVTRGKPAPEGYLKAAAALGRRPGACIVMEDTPAGVSAGKAAGMTVIAVRGTFPEQQLAGADAVVDSLASIRCVRADAATVQLTLVRSEEES